jgi:hypothetical protein
MAVKQELEISIGADGSIKIEVKGMKGGKCVDLTKELEEELGVVTTREYTSEYYQQEEQQRIRLNNE